MTAAIPCTYGDESNCNVRRNCEWLFHTPNPTFANKPNIVFQAQGEATLCIQNSLKCQFAVYPMEPIYNSDGEWGEWLWCLSDDDFPFENTWHQWSNDYNQKLVHEYCHDRCGVFETNDLIVVDVNSPLEKMEKHNYIIELGEFHGAFFELIYLITSDSNWLMTYLYEKNLFLYLASEQLRENTKEIRESMIEKGIVCGWLDVDERNSLKGYGLFLESVKSTLEKMDGVIKKKKNESPSL